MKIEATHGSGIARLGSAVRPLYMSEHSSSSHHDSEKEGLLLVRAAHSESMIDFGCEMGQFGRADFTVSFWIKTSENA